MSIIKQVKGKTIKQFRFLRDAEGPVVEIDFADGSYFGFSMEYPARAPKISAHFVKDTNSVHEETKEVKITWDKP